MTIDTKYFAVTDTKLVLTALVDHFSSVMYAEKRDDDDYPLSPAGVAYSNVLGVLHQLIDTIEELENAQHYHGVSERELGLAQANARATEARVCKVAARMNELVRELGGGQAERNLF